jgi:glucose/arabinose dehydrogenase
MTRTSAVRAARALLRLETLEDRRLLAPTVLDPDLAVRTAAKRFVQPVSMGFLDANEFFVLEKSTGRVKHVVDGEIAGTALDLNVNSASERGLLGIAMHPHFEDNHFVYLYWTASTTGSDTTDLASVPLLGNRVDRFRWTGSQLVYDSPMIALRAFQADPGQPLRGNHDGGVLRFGHDGKLYIIIGDVGRRGMTQNNLMGPFPDDQFGGPEPDDAHFTGVIIRLNDDGTTPTDNPFYDVGAQIPGQTGENIQKMYAFGVRNSFGLAVDPLTGNLWNEENGDDSFDEINRIAPGQNNGWIQVMGPLERIDQFKQIETTAPYVGLQQIRWSPRLIADSPQEALERMWHLEGSTYAEPQFSWKYAVAPAAIGFLGSSALGAAYEGDLFVTASRTFLQNGYIFRFNLSPDRMSLAFDDPLLHDKVADNPDKFTLNESESLQFGTGFGIATDIQTGPNGNLYVVSNTDGAVYEIYRPSAAPAADVATLVTAQPMGELDNIHRIPFARTIATAAFVPASAGFVAPESASRDSVNENSRPLVRPVQLHNAMGDALALPSTIDPLSHGAGLE